MRRIWLGLLLFACERSPALLPETDQHALSIRPPATLADGTRVESRKGAAPGESDLWLVSRTGEARAIASAPGADDMPLILGDGRVAFVSTRSTLASIWIFDPRTGEATQLTNRGLVAGKPREGFVPPPMERWTTVGEELRYESSPGVWWSVDLATGRAQRSESAP